ncbi:MAG: hypothetical protein KDI12_02780 [Anaerolineae bacterium]|nr:hypothetical protein [Anaerolineae bacterium]
MSTQTRLDAYLAAELEILQAQEIRGGDRTHRMAELEEVRKAISDLQRQVTREARSAGRSLGFSLANLSRES